MKGMKRFVFMLFMFALLCGIPSAASALTTIRYTVEPRDNLSKIAKRYGTTVSMIAAFNNIDNPDMIVMGDVLYIPVEDNASGAIDFNDTYTVVRGDTLGKIAARYNTTIESLVDLNGIENPNQIKIGQRLLMQPGSGSAGQATDGYYIVVRGDTLTKIARRFRVSAETLAELNGIENPDFIIVGQRLRIE